MTPVHNRVKQFDEYRLLQTSADSLYFILWLTENQWSLSLIDVVIRSNFRFPKIKWTAAFNTDCAEWTAPKQIYIDRHNILLITMLTYCNCANFISILCQFYTTIVSILYHHCANFKPPLYQFYPTNVSILYHNSQFHTTIVPILYHHCANFIPPLCQFYTTILQILYHHCAKFIPLVCQFHTTTVPILYH